MNDQDLQLARDTLLREKAAFVLVKNGVILGVGHGQSIQPLWEFLNTRISQMENATLADKIVGRAVAFIAAKFHLSCVFGEILSEGAREILESQGMCWKAENRVPMILNRAGDGSCPIEKGLRNITNTDQAIAFLKEKGFFRTQ